MGSLPDLGLDWATLLWPRSLPAAPPSGSLISPVKWGCCSACPDLHVRTVRQWSRAMRIVGLETSDLPQAQSESWICFGFL